MTHHPDLHARLLAHRFTDGMAPQLVDQLASLATFAEFHTGSWLGVQGKPADRFHLVDEGRCAIEMHAASNHPIVIATVHPGEVVGWSWMLAPHVWHFDVLALEPTRTISIDGTALNAACRADHELGFEINHRLARVIASRLEATRLQLVDVYAQHR
jgi:CRP-like cAMP-binding protein